MDMSFKPEHINFQMYVSIRSYCVFLIKIGNPISNNYFLVDFEQIIYKIKKILQPIFYVNHSKKGG